VFRFVARRWQSHNGETMDDEQKARYAELEEKMRYRAALLAEIVAEEKRLRATQS
jgi:hypothetical protein